MSHRFGHIFVLLMLGVLIGCSSSFQAPQEAGQHGSAAPPAGAAALRPALPATSQAPTPTVRTLSATREAAAPTRTMVPTSLPSFSPTALPLLTPSPPLDLALVGGTLIDGSGAAAMVDAVVTIRGDRIVAIGRQDEVPIPPHTPTHDVRGMTILPSVINAHAHTDTLTDDLKQWTRAGVTTIRDLCGPRDMLIKRRGTLSATTDPAFPRLLVAGPIVTVPGGHPIPVYGLNDEILVVEGPVDARAKITALPDAGSMWSRSRSAGERMSGGRSSRTKQVMPSWRPRIGGAYASQRISIVRLPCAAPLSRGWMTRRICPVIVFRTT